MRRIRLGAVVLFLLVGIFAGTAPAHADDQTWFNEFFVDATLDEDGRMHVTTQVEYDFQELASRGIYLNFVTRQDIEGDPDHERVYEFSEFAVSSSSGAATDVRVEESRSGVGVYIGDPDKQNLTGIHSYEVSYVVDGIPNAGVGEGGEGEIYWNIIGSGFAEPIKDFRMSLHAPATPTRTNCFYGSSGSADPCGATSIEGDAAEFRQQNVEAGKGVTIAAEYPAGSFDDSWAIIRPRYKAPVRPKPELSSSTIIGLGVGTVATALAGVLAFVRRRDEVYVGLPPGVEPAPGQDVAVRRMRQPKDFAVQFHPPRGVSPAEIGAVVAKATKPDFIAATIVDLAVRGYLVITPTDDGATVRRTEKAHDTLTTHEQNVLAGLFEDEEETVSLDDISDDGERALREEVVEMGARVVERGWFTRALGSSRPRSRQAIGFIFVLVVVFFQTIQSRGALGPVVPIAAFGFLVFFILRGGTRRTAQGSAIYAQAMGFRKFLETADANRLRFEANEDIFSAYLPYAMVYGVVDKWVHLFASLPADVTGSMGAMTWIDGTGSHLNFSQQLSQIDMASTLMSVQSTTTLAAQARSTSGSSGGSSFSSSGGSFGGSSGGGVSGGGGGRW